MAGLVAAVLSAAFGANAVAIKMSLLGIGPFTAAGLRLTMASVAILLWARSTGRTLRVDKEQVRTLVVMSLLFTIQLSLLYLGISRTNASRATLIINIDPFLILILAHFFIKGDTITSKKLLGIVMAFSGVALVFLQKEGVTEDFRVGDVITLVCTLMWACRTVYLKRVIHAFDPFHMVLYPMIFSIPFLFVQGFLWDKPMIDHLDGVVISGMLYQVGIASFGWVAWMGLLQKHGAVALHTFMFVSPITGVFLGSLVMAEPIGTHVFLALILISAGIMVAQGRFRATKHQEIRADAAP